MNFRKIFFFTLMILANCENQKSKLNFEQKVNKSGFTYNHYIENGELHFGIYKYSHLEEKVTLYPKYIDAITIEELETKKKIWGLNCNSSYTIMKTAKYGDNWGCDFLSDLGNLKVLKSNITYKLNVFDGSFKDEEEDQYIFNLKDDFDPFLKIKN